MHDDFEKFVQPFEAEFEKRLGWQIEIEKILLNQALTLNWAALVAVPAFVASTKAKEQIIAIAFCPMVAFSTGLILAIATGALLFTGYGDAVRESDENANVFTTWLLIKHTGQHPLDPDLENPQFAGAKNRANRHRSAGKRTLKIAAFVGAGSFACFIAGTVIFLIALAR